MEPAAGTLDALKAQAATCQRCPLWKPATQTVFGEGPPDAPVVFVGEQPGDQEDLAGGRSSGRPGRCSTARLPRPASTARASMSPTRSSISNTSRAASGASTRRRTTPRSTIAAGGWSNELALIQPQLTVALGATAARALTGRSVTISRERGADRLVRGTAAPGSSPCIRRSCCGCPTRPRRPPSTGALSRICGSSAANCRPSAKAA